MKAKLSEIVIDGGKYTGESGLVEMNAKEAYRLAYHCERTLGTGLIPRNELAENIIMAAKHAMIERDADFQGFRHWWRASKFWSLMTERFNHLVFDYEEPF